MNAVIDIAALAEQLRRVTVEVTDAGELLGSGVLWPQGFVVTNAHVVRRPEVTLRLVDGRCVHARVLARDSDADLALLGVPGTGLPSASMAESESIRIGSFVAAVGHPLGVRGALATGIVCAVGPIDRRGRSWIQADLRLAPGNSGGPLADAAGRVVGVNSRAAGPLALAVPMSQVARLRARRTGVSVAERRRLPSRESERERSTAVFVVAGSGLVAARIEAMLRSRSDLSVTVSGSAELGRSLEDHALAVVVLALSPDATAKALEILRGLPGVAAVVLLASDPLVAWTGPGSPLGGSRGPSRRRDRRGARRGDRRRQSRPRRPSSRCAARRSRGARGRAPRSRAGADTTRARDPRDAGRGDEQSDHRGAARDLEPDGEVPRGLDPGEAGRGEPHGGGHVRRATRADRALELGGRRDDRSGVELAASHLEHRGAELVAVDGLRQDPSGSRRHGCARCGRRPAAARWPEHCDPGARAPAAAAR